MRKLRSISLLVLTFSMCLNACRKETKAIYRNLTADSSYISITNASPVVSNLLFYVDNQQVHLPDSPLSFGTTTYATYINNSNQINPTVQTLPYIKIPTGYNKISLNSSSPSGYNLMSNYFQNGANYSVFVTDTIIHGQFSSVILEDNIGLGDTSSGQVRFLNLSPDAPALDVYAFADAGPNGYRVFSGCGYLPNDYSSLVNGESFTSMTYGPYYF